ncbi:MAG: thiamine pyrophosphate-dependent enzyme, partial [Acidimicrobiaceae bacterium]|nr:thiamine pyrophosphate-dependent enzyme [Acidimicrobiaceae bacterium]
SLHIPYEAVKWRRDFNPVDREGAMLEKQAKVNQIINQYRVRGHLIADLNPLRYEAPVMHAELDPATYGLTIWDLDREFLTGSETGIYATVGGTRRMKLGDLLGVLRDAYCRTVGVEYMHIQEPEEKRWIQEQIEGADTTLKGEDQRRILSQLNAAEALSNFLGTKYVGQKRFGLEGAESTIPLLDALLTCAADEPLAEVVMGMAHRGRLNILVNLVGKTYHELFKEFEGAITTEQIQGSGDVKYHLGQIGAYTSPSGKHLLVEMAANPPHIEAVDPVVVGMARARMDNIPPDSSYGPYPVMPLLIHGDAAFAGQGVVAETFNLSLIRGYRVGGTIHLVIDNQLGFTTTPDAARSTQYSTDVAKMVGAPIFHVNGDDPEACVRAAHLAFAYRQRFNKDAVIDMICYRRHGHNEGDDPSYTLPDMYRRINAKPTVRTQYRESLLKRGDMNAEEVDASLAEYRDQLQAALDETRDAAPGHNIRARRPPEPMGVMPHVRTSIDSVTVERIYEALNTVPEGFTVHPKLARQFEQRNTL